MPNPASNAGSPASVRFAQPSFTYAWVSPSCASRTDVLTAA